MIRTTAQIHKEVMDTCLVLDEFKPLLKKEWIDLEEFNKETNKIFQDLLNQHGKENHNSIRVFASSIKMIILHYKEKNIIEGGK